MERSSTFFLRTVVVLIGLIVLALCTFALPAGLRHTGFEGYGPILLGMYITALPFFIALYHTLRLLGYIDANKAFSHASAQALSVIKYCALIIGGLYAIGLPYIYLLAKHDDAPGVMLLALVFTFGPLAVAVFAAILQKLLQDTIRIKSENDLTI